MRFWRDYRIIAIPLVGLSAHYLYLKEHKDYNTWKNKEKDDSKVKITSKSLFVGNIDIIIGFDKLTDLQIDSMLRELFGSFGDIESIAISQFNKIEESDRKNLSKSRFAHINYTQTASVISALKASDDVYYALGQHFIQSNAFVPFSKCLSVKTSKEIQQKLVIPLILFLYQYLLFH